MDRCNLNIKEGYFKLTERYLFSDIRKKVNDYKKEYGKEVIDMSVGDVAYPIPRIAVDAMITASREMGDNVRKRGYPPENGYDFLRNALADRYFKNGVNISTDEILIGDGSKTDVALFADIFDNPATVIIEPCYPVYIDCALMSGRRVYNLHGNKNNYFLPLPDELEKQPYVIYLCSPNNPTGASYDKKGLEKWIDFANETESIILFDAAYSAFARKDFVKSVYEIKGARKCAVEFGSFSKFAGFTGLRCSWTLIPKDLKIGEKRLLEVVKRRKSAIFNGVSYVTQRAAQAVLSDKGCMECSEIINKYLSCSKLLRKYLVDKGIFATGGENCPYLWAECPNGVSSYDFFENMLLNSKVVCTPGAGFGASGEGFIRLSCFQTEETVLKALSNFKLSGIFD